MAVLSERGELPWWPGRRGQRKRSLNADRIIDAALALLDRDGLGGLSMRRLGAELGSGATSIYWHVPSKEALLDLLVDRLMAEAADATRHEPGATWRDELAAHSVALRQVLQHHVGGAALLVSRTPVGPNGLRFMEGVLRALTDAGFRGRRRALAYAALTGYTVGQLAADEQPRRLGGLLAGAPRGRYPNVVESADDLTELTDDEAFDYGLQRMLDGLEAELAPFNPRPPAF